MRTKRTVPTSKREPSLSVRKKPPAPSVRQGGSERGGWRSVEAIRVECLHCRHVGSLAEPDLIRRGVKPDAPIVSFLKRLRCRKCGSQSVRVERLVQQRAS